MVAVSRAQVDARELAGDEPAPAGEVVEPGIGQARLLAERDAGPARVAERADEHGGEHAASTSWPMASVIERCSVSRSSEKSNVSPPTSPAGSSQAASVNCPASQV